MCGRFVAFTDPEGIARLLLVDDRTAEDVPPSYNVAPTHRVHAVTEHTGRRTLAAFRWGLVPPWAEGPAVGAPLINARAETAASKPAFRDAFARRRCLIPADGFYEWGRGPGGTKVPHYVHATDGLPLVFAGLWESWRGRDPEQHEVRACVILTTSASPPLSTLHDRSPVVLPPTAWAEWLDPAHPHPRDLSRLLTPAPEHALSLHPVSQQANHPRHNHAGLIAPVAEQLRLT